MDERPLSDLESPRRHRGRTALVTGAARGLGQEYSRRLAAEGARIVAVDVSSSAETIEIAGKAAAAAAEGSSAEPAEPAEPLAFECDLADPDAIAGMAAEVASAAPVDILIHNAAITPMGPLLDADFEQWRKVMSVNLDSLFLLAKALVPGMVERGWGRVIGISTGMFHAGTPGQIAYLTSKAGTIGFVRSLASEVGASGVTANAVAPGLTVTPGSKDTLSAMPEIYDQLAAVQAVKRNGQPRDLSGTVSFLASDDAAWLTGQTLLVDGGLSFV